MDPCGRAPGLSPLGAWRKGLRAGETVALAETERYSSDRRHRRPDEERVIGETLLVRESCQVVRFAILADGLEAG